MRVPYEYHRKALAPYPALIDEQPLCSEAFFYARSIIGAYTEAQVNALYAALVAFKRREVDVLTSELVATRHGHAAITPNVPAREFHSGFQDTQPMTGGC